MKKTFKKLLSILMVFCMVMGMVPDVLLSASAIYLEEYDVWVAGVRVTSDNAGDILGDGAAFYDPDSNTLTVSDDITATNAHAIHAETVSDFTVHIDGSVTLTVNDTDPMNHYTGIAYVGSGDLIITGGTLTVDSSYSAIYAYNDDYDNNITIDCSALNLTSDEGIGIETFYGSIDVDCDNSIVINAYFDGIVAKYGSVNLKAIGDVTIDAAGYDIYGYEDVTVDCNQFEATGDNGIYAYSGSVNLKAGNVAIDAVDCAIYGYEGVTVECNQFEAAADYGIYAEDAEDGSVNLKAGDVAIEATECAIYGYENVTVDCDKFEAAADYGIYADSGSVNLKAGDVAIEATKRAIYGEVNVTVECNQFEATGDDGIYAYSGSANLKAGDVAIDANERAIYGYEYVTVECNQFEVAGDYGIYAGDGSVNLKAGDVAIEATECAIYGYENVTVDCDKFEAAADYGIYAENAEDAEDGSVNLKAGDVTIEAVHYAIYSNEDVTIDCDKFEATGNCGIYGYEDITINCADRTITGGNYGIAADKGSIIIENGDFDIQSTEAGEYETDYHALYFGEDFTYPTGTSVVAATEVDGDFEEYDRDKNTTYDHVKIGAVEEPEVPATTSVTVVKEWNVPEGTNIPGFIEVYLLANGQQVGDTPVRLTADADWTYTFENLPIANEEGKAIEYTVAEVEIEGFESSVGDAIETDTGIEIAITNSLKATEPEAPATTTVTVVKEWDVPEGTVLPESVRVAIYANGEKLLENVLSDRNNWTWTEELTAAMEDGTPIVYTADEVEVPEGYEKTIGEAVETETGIEIAITNTLKETEPEVPETVTVAGTKTWVGDTEADRPESIIVNLLANGEVIDETEVTRETQWTFYFDELPKCDESGAEIEYSVEEEEVEGYTATYDGYNITNTLKEDGKDNEGEEGGSTPAPTPTPAPTNPPAPPAPSVPDTSDNTGTFMYLTALVCSAVALAVVLKKKKQAEE